VPLKSGVTLYFLRHGQTDWNRLKRLQGQIDIPLNDTGRAQAAGNGRRLRSKLGELLDGLAFVSSPLMRTRETMEIAREAAGLPRQGYDLDPLLKEVNYGHWEGAYLDQLKREDPEGFEQRRTDKFHWRPVGGESYAELQARVDTWLTTVERDSVVVSHGGVSRVLRGLVNAGLLSDEVPNLEVPQDKVMVVKADGFSWL
jgi:broad specificity phosphatase PhoE